MYFTANSAVTAGFMDQPPLKLAEARTISLRAECCSYALLHRKRASRRVGKRFSRFLLRTRFYTTRVTFRPEHLQQHAYTESRLIRSPRRHGRPALAADRGLSRAQSSC